MGRTILRLICVVGFNPGARCWFSVIGEILPEELNTPGLLQHQEASGMKVRPK